MPAYKSFVIAGAGNLGSNIATQLAKEGFQVTALSRVESDSDTSKLSSNGVKVHKVNYQDKASLSEAIKGHEVLINTLGAGSFQGDLHEALPTLAKEAGTQLYVPNDWGVDYSIVLESKHPEIHPFIASKPHVAEKLKGLGLPYLQFFPGVFGSYVALLLEVDKQARTAKVVGPGTAPFTSTTEKEIGQFVAKAFANLPKSELENRGLRVSSKSRQSPVSIFEEIQASQGGEAWKVEHVPIEEANKAAKDLALGPQSFFAWLNLVLSQGGLDQQDDNEKVGFQSKVSLVDIVLGNFEKE